MLDEAKTEANALMGEADDLLFRMRMLAGSGDVDGASRIMKESLDLLNDASALDRQEDCEESAMALGYVIDQLAEVSCNISGLPVGNKSRTAKEAKMYREEQEASHG